MEKNLVTFADLTPPEHRSHIIIRRTDAPFYIAEFDSADQFFFFLGTLGVTASAVEWKESDRLGILRTYELSHAIEDGGYFKSDFDLPAGARPIKALSNGSIVTCYFTNDGKRVKIYRPNPNYPAVFKPMTLEQQIAHRAIYGLY